jgi:hypothetical protein
MQDERTAVDVDGAALAKVDEKAPYIASVVSIIKNPNMIILLTLIVISI